MNKILDKNILITLWYADGLHGGVKYSAELGNFFHSIGYNVYLCAVKTKDDTKKFLAQNHITVFDIHDDLPDVNFDIVWAHHWPIFPYLIRKGLRYKKLINSCISSVLFLERPIMLDNNIDMYLCLTQSMKETLATQYNITDNKIHVLPNTAPDEFFIQKPQNKNITNIAIVSNHVPQELLDAVKIFEHNKIAVTIYGGKNPVNITPDVLARHDVIISIGKTVQYCLAMGKPVYNYDYFGDSGYITPENIDIEEKQIFSGRSFCTKKTAQQIVDEIINQYTYVVSLQNDLRKIADTRYKLSVQINRILNKLDQTPHKEPLVENNDCRLLIDYCCLVVDGTGASSLQDFPKTPKQKEKPLKRLIRHIKHLKF